MSPVGFLWCRYCRNGQIGINVSRETLRKGKMETEYLVEIVYRIPRNRNGKMVRRIVETQGTARDAYEMVSELYRRGDWVEIDAHITSDPQRVNNARPYETM